MKTWRRSGVTGSRRAVAFGPCCRSPGSFVLSLTTRRKLTKPLGGDPRSADRNHAAAVAWPQVQLEKARLALVNGSSPSDPLPPPAPSVPRITSGPLGISRDGFWAGVVRAQRQFDCPEAEPSRFCWGSYGSTPSSAAVAGTRCPSPIAPAGERAVGLTRIRPRCWRDAERASRLRRGQQHAGRDGRCIRSRPPTPDRRRPDAHGAYGGCSYGRVLKRRVAGSAPFSDVGLRRSSGAPRAAEIEDRARDACRALPRRIEADNAVSRGQRSVAVQKKRG